VEVTGRVWETDEGKVRWWLWGWAVDREAWDSIAPHSQLCVSVPDNLGLPHDVCVIKGAWQLTFTVEPEHKYHIRFETEDEGLPSTGPIAIESDYRTQVFTGGLTPARVHPYVEDETTGQRVSTCTPIEDRELAKTPGWS
jgi:hypothetical protein